MAWLRSRVLGQTCSRPTVPEFTVRNTRKGGRFGLAQSAVLLLVRRASCSTASTAVLCCCATTSHARSVYLRLIDELCPGAHGHPARRGAASPIC